MLWEKFEVHLFHLPIQPSKNASSYLVIPVSGLELTIKDIIDTFN